MLKDSLHWNDLKDYLICPKRAYLNIYDSRRKEVVKDSSVVGLIKSLGNEFNDGAKNMAKEKYECRTILLNEDRFTTRYNNLTIKYGRFEACLDNVTINSKQIRIVDYQANFWPKKPEDVLMMAFYYKILTGLELEKELVFNLALVNETIDEPIGSPLRIYKVFRLFKYKTKAINAQYLLDNLIEEYDKKLSNRQIVPKTEYGSHCEFPDKCQFYNVCWKDKSPTSVQNMTKFSERRKHLLSIAGYTNAEELTKTEARSKLQQREAKKLTELQPEYNKNIIEKYIGKIKPSLVRTFMYCRSTKMIYSTRPGVTINSELPTFISIMNFNSDSDYQINHYYQAFNIKIYTLEYIEKLLNNLEICDTIICYNSEPIINAIDTLDKLYPEYSSSILKLKAKLIDLKSLFQNRAIVHPKISVHYEFRSVIEHLLKLTQEDVVNYNTESKLTNNIYLSLPYLNKSDQIELIQVIERLNAHRLKNINSLYEAIKLILKH